MLICIAIFIINTATVKEHFAESNIIQTFRLWSWIFYFILGAYIKQINRRVKVKTCLTILFVTIVANIAMEKYFETYTGFHWIPCEYYYVCPITMIMVTSLIMVCKQIHLQENCSTKIMSQIFLPVYAIHLSIISFVEKILSHIQTGLIAPLVATILTIIIAVTISAIIMRFTLFKKIFRI